MDYAERNGRRRFLPSTGAKGDRKDVAWNDRRSSSSVDPPPTSYRGRRSSVENLQVDLHKMGLRETSTSSHHFRTIDDSFIKAVRAATAAAADAASPPHPRPLSPREARMAEKAGVLSRLSAVVGMRLAEKVTRRHPRERDLNRLASLALDMDSNPPPSASTYRSRRGHTSDRSSMRPPFSRGVYHHSSICRTPATLTTKEEVSLEKNDKDAVPPSSLLIVVDDEEEEEDIRTEETQEEEEGEEGDIRTDETQEEEDLIDWDGDLLREEVFDSVSSHSIVESSHLLD